MTASQGIAPGSFDSGRVVRELLNVMDGCASRIATGALAATAGGILGLNYLQTVYGAEKLAPMVAMTCGTTAVVGGLVAIGGRVAWKYYRALPDESEQEAFAPLKGSVVGDDGWWVEHMARMYNARRKHPGLPVGWRMAHHKLVEANPHVGEPHLMVTGKTGTGKSKAALRPIAAAAASTGLYQVVILDKSGKDFNILAQHPNIHIVRYDADTLAPIAATVYQLVSQRMRLLAEHPDHPGSIGELPASQQPPRVLVIIDELGNAYNMLRLQDAETAKEFDVSMLAVAQEGRAYGVHLVVATQRPSADQINTSFRSQLNSLTFAVRDKTDARIVNALGDDTLGIPAAHELGGGQAIFMSNNGPRLLEMYYPSNNELAALLALNLDELRARNRLHGAPQWLGAFAPGGAPYEVGQRRTRGGDESGDDRGDAQGGRAGNPLIAPRPARRAASEAPADPPPSQGRASRDAAQMMAVVAQMVSCLAEDDGTPHPTIKGATMAQVKAASFGLLYLERAEVARILRKRSAAQRLLAQHDGARRGPDPSLSVEEQIAWLIAHDDGPPMHFPEGDAVAEALQGASAAMYAAAKLGLESGMGVTAVARIIFPRVKSPNNTRHKPFVRAVRDREGIPTLGPTGKPDDDAS